MSWVSAGIAGVTLGINYFNAKSKEKQAKQGIAELEKDPYAKFKTGQDIYNQANQLATGLTSKEIANEQQGYNRLANQRYRLGVAKNPSLSGAVQAGVNYGSVQNNLGLAAQDAAARRQSLHSLISLISGQSNNQTQNIQQQMEAYGQAASDQSINQNNDLNNFANTALTAALYNPIYGKKTKPPIDYYGLNA